MEKEWPDFEKNPEAEEFRKMFVGGLELKTTEETLKEFFSTYGTIEDVLLMKDKNNPPKSKGFAFVTFVSSESLDEVQKNRPHVIDGKKIETKRATPKQQQYWSTKKLYIKDFAKDCDEEELVADMKDMFGKFGNVKDVHLVKEKGDAGLKGYGFIEFDDEDPVDKCNLLRKFTLKDRQVKVAKAFNQDKGGGGGGKGGRGGAYYNGYDDYYNYGYYYPPFPYVGGGRGGDYGRNYGYDNSYNYRRGGRGYSRGGGGRAYRGGY